MKRAATDTQPPGSCDSCERHPARHVIPGMTWDGLKRVPFRVCDGCFNRLAPRRAWRASDEPRELEDELPREEP